VSNGVGVRRGRYLRGVIALGVVAVLLAAALVATVGSLNRDVYSAGGFVRQYLDALADHDTATALALPGIRPSAADLEADGLPADLPDTLLRDSVLGSLTDIELVSDEAGTGESSHIHTVTYAFAVDGQKSEMAFTVERVGNVAGVFDTWGFVTSPLAVLRVNVLHDATFTVNGLTLDTRAHAAEDAPVSFSNQAAYLAFAPTLYTVSHESVLLTAAEQAVPVVASGAVDIAVDAAPNETFTGQVQAKLDEYLDECATQEVLLPSNCPFGIEIDNRVRSAPEWSIADYPDVALTAGEDSFDMPATPGQAHIVVDVQSLYDGSRDTRDEDVPFSVGLSVTIQGDGALAIQLR